MRSANHAHPGGHHARDPVRIDWRSAASRLEGRHPARPSREARRRPGLPRHLALPRVRGARGSLRRLGREAAEALAGDVIARLQAPDDRSRPPLRGAGRFRDGAKADPPARALRDRWIPEGHGRGEELVARSSAAALRGRRRAFDPRRAHRRDGPQLLVPQAQLRLGDPSRRDRRHPPRREGLRRLGERHLQATPGAAGRSRPSGGRAFLGPGLYEGRPLHGVPSRTHPGSTAPPSTTSS